jgi:cytochrome c553
MRRSFITGLLLLFISHSALALAEPSERGETISRQGKGEGVTACITCHGEQGQGNVAMAAPYLASLPSDYLVRQLQAFKAKQRHNAMMQPIAMILDDSDIQAVAAYFSQLPPPAEALGKTSAAAQLKLGEEIARNGRWMNGVPACFQCHGAAGQGIAPNFPPLSGQPADYLKQQLYAWAEGTRSGDPIDLMQSVAKGLTAGERDAVAQYLASLSPRVSAADSGAPAKQD